MRRHSLTVPTGDFEAIGGPAQVGSNRDDLTVVRSTWRLSGVLQDFLVEDRPISQLRTT